MRIILCHNFYQLTGGEDHVFADELELLRSHGHEVRTFTRHNDEIKTMSRLGVAAATVWNRAVAKSLADQVREFRADVVHFHNTVPLISPAAFRAASKAGAAVVLTMHNYRLMCPKATFFRDGKTCEACLGRWPLPAIRHACYRDSRAGSAVVASMLVTHRLMGTYRRFIDTYIGLSEFARQKYIQAGIPEDRLELKPNFLTRDPGPGRGEGGYMMFLGRLSPEKGLTVLLDAWVKHACPVPLRVVGRGPQAGAVRAAMEKNPSIVFHEGETMERIIELLGDASALILPSVNYEGFPKTIVESLSRGTPVIASKIGSVAELIVPGRSGLHFTPGDGESLMECVQRTIADPSLLPSMRESSRQQFVDHYTADVNYELLKGIYQRAIARRHGRALIEPATEEAAGDQGASRELEQVRA